MSTNPKDPAVMPPVEADAMPSGSMNRAENSEDGIRLTPLEKQRQRNRSRAIGFAIAGVCVLFYVITVFKMGPAVLNRSM